MEDVDELIKEFDLQIGLDDQHRQLIKAGLGTNPRRIKRFMNTLSVHLHLAEISKKAGRNIKDWFINGNEPRKFDYFLKLLLISYSHSGVFAIIMEEPGILSRLQRISNQYENAKAQKPVEARELRMTALLTELPIVQNLHNDEDFWRLIAKKPSMLDEPNLIKQLLSWFRNKPVVD